MSHKISPRDLPVLLVYNVDPSWAAPDQAEVTRETERLGTAMQTLGHPVRLVPLTSPDVARALAPHDPRDSVLLNWCEELPGVPHSEAKAVAAFEELGFVYTGATAEVLTLSEDKRRVKERLLEHRVPTPEGGVFESADEVAWERFPAIVKPANEHCSLGVTSESVVTGLEELRDRVGRVIRRFREPALVEDFIDGREFHVTLWGNGRIEMLPPAEMDFSDFSDFHDRLCTYDAKFVPDSRHYTHIRTLLPAPLTEEELAELERVAKAAYRAIGCRDYARIDIRLRDGVFYALDVNPNADISAEASMACAAEAMGCSYGDMGSRLVRLAAQRHPILSGRR